MVVQELPEELIRIILSMLPVKSLMRFKCVSKSWYALIKSPNFVDLHLKNRSSVANKQNDFVIVKRFLQHQPTSRLVLSIFSYETLDDLSTNIDIPFFKRDYCVIILCPCNGLICITDQNHYDIVICNPATREFKSIPVPPKFGPGKMVHWPHAVGFGFDPNSGDYKVVRFVHHYRDKDDNDDDYDAGYRKAEVYNLSTNSWREIDATVPAVLFYSYRFETLLNGAFHWYVMMGVGGDWVLSFHVCNEVIQLIPLPDFCSLFNGLVRTLAVLNESLALILHERDSMEKHFEIWVMNKYGVKGSWSMLFKLEPLLGIGHPFAFRKNSELLLETNNGQLVSYDLKHQNLKQFPIYGVPSTSPRVLTSLGVLAFSESLVSVNVVKDM